MLKSSQNKKYHCKDEYDSQRQKGWKYEEIFFPKITNKSGQSEIIFTIKSHLLASCPLLAPYAELNKYLKLNQCLYFGYVSLRE